MPMIATPIALPTCCTDDRTPAGVRAESPRPAASTSAPSASACRPIRAATACAATDAARKLIPSQLKVWPDSSAHAAAQLQVEGERQEERSQSREVCQRTDSADAERAGPHQPHVDQRNAAAARHAKLPPHEVG